jgi:hypothetical protein
MPALMLNRPADHRRSISPASMEAVITGAVRKAGPCCEAFVGVFVERTAPESPSEPNWTIKGVKFGRAERESAGEVLTAIVEHLQREFDLSTG